MNLIIFLDIDGVLNGHHFMREAQSCNICRPCVLQLNRIIRTTGAKVVLSSAWRYMIHGGAMTLSGFAYMLRTHGFSGINNIIGLTESDETCPHCEYRHKRRRGKVECAWNAKNFRVCVKCSKESTRGAQVRRWLKKHRGEYGRVVVIDDDAFDFDKLSLPFVQTDAKLGLTRRKADAVIRVLKGRH
jgi:hypothetical protein